MLNTAHFNADDLEIVSRCESGNLPSPGSFVRLNSGGPLGVVSELMADDHVRVSWLVWPIEHSVIPDRCVGVECCS